MPSLRTSSSVTCGGKYILTGFILRLSFRAMTPQIALQKAIKIAGGYSALGRRLKINRQAVSQWIKAPAERVLSIEEATGAQISRHDLRPDLYPRDGS